MQPGMGVQPGMGMQPGMQQRYASPMQPGMPQMGMQFTPPQFGGKTSPNDKTGSQGGGSLL
jgi:hypothetical protein